jgi:hypothetical protein
MKLKGWVRDSDSMVKFGERVRARGGTLNVESTLPDSSRPRYKLSFEATYLPKKNAER